MSAYWLSILKEVQEGKVSPEEAWKSFSKLSFEELGFAKIDHHRKIRQGMTEVIYCPGKTEEQIEEIFTRLAKTGGNVLATRAWEKVYQRLSRIFPEIKYFPLSRLLLLQQEEAPLKGRVALVTAGTADQAVAEEAAITMELMGSKVERLYDLGVAGIHRLLSHQTRLEEAKVIVVVAGMEGALASVVGGLVSKPIIAVPTSVGYGANLKGVAPLLTMLNSCAAGVAVVNIDNGFGAAVLAHRINMLGVSDR